MSLKTKLIFLFGCMTSVFAFGQLDTYHHKIKISGIKDQWHKIKLPDVVFEKASQSMNDIRIYGLTENDTLEAPYILQVGKGQYSQKDIDFKLLNTVFNTHSFYYTYEIPTQEDINRIQLDFKNENFDWKITLEASNNQQEWFTILEEYRILSIINGQTNYAFTDLNFTQSKYRYYRLLIKSDEKPELNSAKISVLTEISPKYQDHAVAHTDIKEENKNTILDIDLKKRVSISFLKINISDEIDYYRPFSIAYISDSVSTEKGWRYSYRKLSAGTLSSIKENEFKFPSTLAQKLRITILNYDNQPLTIESASTKGYLHELVTRITKPATYYLAYGKTTSKKPQYDISQAATKIPKALSTLTLGEVQDIPKKEIPTVAPLFVNKLWLWAVMGLLIIVLGGFTFKMMQKK